MSDETTEQIQMALCRQYGRDFVPCPLESKFGLAFQTLGQVAINGLRHRSAGSTNGWYIWAGQYSSEKDFVQPLHRSHSPQRLPQFVRLLGAAHWSRQVNPARHTLETPIARFSRTLTSGLKARHGRGRV